MIWQNCGGGDWLTLQDILSRLDGAKGHDGQYTARCPAHEDSKASLSVSVGKDGRVLMKCHAGCQTTDIVSRLGLTMKDLFVEPMDKPPAYQGKKPRREIVAKYDYRDSSGKLLAQKLRYEPKSFSWRRPDGHGGWIYDRKGVPYCLYVAGDIEGAVLVCEGEKDADRLHALGFTAVSGQDGAGHGKWHKEYTERLRGQAVCVFQDNDQVGKEYAVEVCNALHGVAESVRLLDISTVWPEIPEHGDVSDLIDHFGDEKACEMIARLTATAEWKPARTDKPTLVRALDVPYEPPRWTIAPYIQRGKGTLVQADNGIGKTAFVCAIAAHVSTGRPVLDIPVETPGDVILLSVEDDLPVLRGRIEASGGDLRKCHFMTNAAGLTFNSPEIEQAVKQVDAKLVIFDPLQAFMGANVDMFRANQTRPELAKLFEMCGRNDCACIIIAHMSKNSTEKTPVNRALGSADIPAAMRSILQIIPNPDNEYERIAVHVKCSNAPKGRSITYTIGDRGGVQWVGYSPMTADDLTTVLKRKEKGIQYENEPLVQVFNQLITDRPGGGFWSYADLKSEGAKILGFPPFIDLNDLRHKLDNGLAKELQARDGLIVTHGERGLNNVRGIRIEQYKLPDGYQTKIMDN